jgi:uncharacterized cofD-like protein
MILTSRNDQRRGARRAVERDGELPAVRGRVVRCATDDVSLVTELDDGGWVPEDATIAVVRRHIRCLCIRPESVRSAPPAREAIAAADLIVLGPGRVYTDLLPILLVREIAEEIGRSRARVVLVMNLMTEPGETDGYVASDCVLTIRQHAPEVPIHDVLLNDAPIRSDLVVRYARQGALPMGYDTEALEALGCRPVKCDLLWDGPVVRHDPRKMWGALLGLVADTRTRARDRRRVRAAQTATEALVWG